MDMHQSEKKAERTKQITLEIDGSKRETDKKTDRSKGDNINEGREGAKMREKNEEKKIIIV